MLRHHAGTYPVIGKSVREIINMAFEFDGEKYKKASSHQKEWGKRIISELKLQGDERILDLGCGDGTVTAQLSQCVKNGFVLGIDASKGMIDTADMNFNNEFDLIFSNATLHWIKDHSRLMDNCKRALKKGGLIRFNFAAHGNCIHFFKIIRETMALNRYTQYFNKFEWPWFMPEMDDYTRLVEKCCFSEILVWGENADRYFPDAESMAGWIDQPSLVPFLKYVPQNVKEGFRDRVVSKMLESTGQENGTFFETFRRINVYAVK
jgi:trans-aconitate methyltransferase